MSDSIANVVHSIKVTKIKYSICYWFGEHCQTATAIATAESGLNPQAKGWNCMYGNVSKACHPNDRGRAWSVDCGVFQINFKGQECPPEAFDADWNIQKAYEWKFKRSGWHPWSVFKNGSYLKYL